MKRLVIPFLMISTSLARAEEAPQADYSGSKDQLKPSQVNYQGESTNPANASGLFLGAGASFGQALPTDDGSPGLAYLLHVEPGYQVETGSWSRLELSADMFLGKLSFRHDDTAAGTGGKVDMPIGFGIMPKVGYGYSLGGRMMGLVKAGVGPVIAKFEVDDAKSDGQVSGLAAMLGWDMVVPVSDMLDFTGGISLTHMQFDVDELELPGGAKFKYDRSVNVNVPEARLGLRVRF